MSTQTARHTNDNEVEHIEKDLSLVLADVLAVLHLETIIG